MEVPVRLQLFAAVLFLNAATAWAQREPLVDKMPSVAPGNPSPRYPEMLRSSGVEGEVTVVFVVDTLGRADTATFRVLKSTHDLFTSAVRATLPSMKFYPAELDRKKIQHTLQMWFPFSIPPDVPATRSGAWKVFLTNMQDAATTSRPILGRGCSQRGVGREVALVARPGISYDLAAWRAGEWVNTRSPRASDTVRAKIEGLDCVDASIPRAVIVSVGGRLLSMPFREMPRVTDSGDVIRPYVPLTTTLDGDALVWVIVRGREMGLLAAGEIRDSMPIMIRELTADSIARAASERLEQQKAIAVAEAKRRDSLAAARADDDAARKAVAAALIRRRAQLLARGWTAAIVDDVLSRRISIGMTAEVAIESWGRPNSVNRTITAAGTSEQWVYGSRSYIYLANGRVTAIQQTTEP